MRALRLRADWTSLAVLLLAVAVIATSIVSCGSGGSSNGELCQQCGSTDGPCVLSGCVLPGATEPMPCPTSQASGDCMSPCVSRNLICRRKVDSAQQRCFPADDSGTEVDFFFRCDGSRPGGTLVPSSPTPTSTAPTPVSTPFCGNGILDSGEQCDGNVIANGATCATFGCGIGAVACNTDCTINTALCSFQPCVVP